MEFAYRWQAAVNCDLVSKQKEMELTTKQVGLAILVYVLHTDTTSREAKTFKKIKKQFVQSDSWKQQTEYGT